MDFVVPQLASDYNRYEQASAFSTDLQRLPYPRVDCGMSHTAATMAAKSRGSVQHMNRRNVLVAVLVWVLLTPGNASANSGPIEDVRVSPPRTPAGVRSPFTGLLAAPVGDAFFTPPMPLPGVPGDVIWASKSPTPCQDLYGAPGGFCTARLPVVRPSNRTAEIWRIMFHSLDRAGRSRAVSAIVVADPPTAASASILVTQHGSYGLGDQCGVIDSQFGGGFAGVGNAAENYLNEGWVIIAPSAPGSRSPGVQTSLISGDSSRSILDAAWAAHVFTGAKLEAVVHGHSIGGMMVTAVGGEATTYAPQLKVRGIIANAPAGLSGPASPLFDPTRGPLFGKSSDPLGAKAKSATLALAAAYEQAYSPNFKSSDYLTPLGLQTWQSIKDFCVDRAESWVRFIPWNKLFRKTLPTLDTGTMQRLSDVPTMIIIANRDEFADPLHVYHAYQTLCAAGQPTYLTAMDVDHISTLKVLGWSDTTGLKTWIKTVAGGSVPAGPCAPMNPSLTSWQKYTFTQVARALNISVPNKSTISVAASGSCRIMRQLINVSPGGSCILNVKVMQGKQTLQTKSQTFSTVG